jgi:DNA-binding transcriptional MerR regulator
MFQVSKVEQITGLTRRQINYWSMTGLVEASVDPGIERQPKFWSFSDLVALRTVRRLREQNVSVQKIRKVLEYAKLTWPDLENHLAQFTFYVLGRGREVLLLGSGDNFPVSALRAQGQLVFVLPGKEVEQEVQQAVLQMSDPPLTPEEAEESSQAWQDYLEGKDPGEPLDQVSQELLEKRKKRHA